MLSGRAIRAANMEAAERAAEADAKPFVYFEADEVDEWGRFPFPYLGDYRPEGWELVDTHFVDSSGFGRTDEPALTQGQFRELVKQRIRMSPVTLGWAVIEAGEFQVFVGEFRRVE